MAFWYFDFIYDALCYEEYLWKKKQKIKTELNLFLESPFCLTVKTQLLHANSVKSGCLRWERKKKSGNFFSLTSLAVGLSSRRLTHCHIFGGMSLICMYTSTHKKQWIYQHYDFFSFTCQMLLYVTGFYLV